MGLISNKNRLKIKAAIKSVTDTFMKKPLVYHRKTTSLDIFQENRNPKKDQTYNLLGFVKFNAGPGGIGTDTYNNEGDGAFDDSDGYILFHIDDLRDAGLLDSNDNFLGASNSDTVIYQGDTLRITGSTLSAQFIDENLLVRLAFKKEIVNG